MSKRNAAVALLAIGAALAACAGNRYGTTLTIHNVPLADKHVRNLSHAVTPIPEPTDTGGGGGWDQTTP
jgi:hypothetical protein